jgi:hypothetical protein
MSEGEGIFLFRYLRLLVRTIVEPGTRCGFPLSGTQKPNGFLIRMKPWTRDHMRVPHSQKPGTLEPIVTCFKMEDKNASRHQRVQKSTKTIFQVDWNSLKNGTLRNENLATHTFAPNFHTIILSLFYQTMNLRISRTNNLKFSFLRPPKPFVKLFLRMRVGRRRLMFRKKGG